MADLGWRRRGGSSPAARRGAPQRAGLMHACASNTLPCQCETLHSKLLGSIKNPIDSDHGIYGDFAAGFGVRMMERGGGAVDLALWHEHDGESERAAAVAAGVLRDKILRVLVVMPQSSDVATRASRLSAENQHKR